MIYKVFMRQSAQKALARIPDTMKQKVIQVIRGLASTPRPHGVKKLTGRDAWRIRVADYRIIYEIQDDRLIIEVIAIGHRGEVYR